MFPLPLTNTWSSHRTYNNWKYLLFFTSLSLGLHEDEGLRGGVFGTHTIPIVP